MGFSQLQQTMMMAMRVRPTHRYAVVTEQIKQEQAELAVWDTFENRRLGSLGWFAWTGKGLHGHCRLAFSRRQRFLLTQGLCHGVLPLTLDSNFGLGVT